MKYFKPLFLFIFLYGFISCSSDDSNNIPEDTAEEETNPEDTTDTIAQYNGLLKEVITEYASGNTAVVKFNYTGNKLKKVVTPSYEKKFTYEGDYITHIQSKNADGIYKNSYDFEYENDKLSKIIYADEDSEEEYFDIEWINDNQVTANYQGIIHTYISTEILLEQGNIIEATDKDYGDIIDIEYAYDDKETPYQNIAGLDALLFNLIEGSYETNTFYTNNNATKQIAHYSDMLVIEVTNYEYEYNDSGLPITQKASLLPEGVLSVDDTTHVYTNTYIYNE